MREALLLEEGAAAPLYTSVTGWTLRDGFSGVQRDARGEVQLRSRWQDRLR